MHQTDLTRKLTASLHSGIKLPRRIRGHAIIVTRVPKHLRISIHKHHITNERTVDRRTHDACMLSSV